MTARLARRDEFFIAHCHEVAKGEQQIIIDLLNRVTG